MQIAISTCDREPQYVHATVEAMFASDERVSKTPVRLVVCGPSSDYLGPYTKFDNVSVDVMDERQWRFATGRTLKHRCTINFRRMLELAVAGQDLIVLQDDVDFAPNWLTRAEAIAGELRTSKGLKRFVLALYASYKFPYKPFCAYNPCKFYGTQALLMPAQVHRDLLAYVARELSAGRYAPDDMMVKQWLLETLVPLRAANPNLVQHVGRKSSLGLHFHDSPSFKQ